MKRCIYTLPEHIPGHSGAFCGVAWHTRIAVESAQRRAQRKRFLDSESSRAGAEVSSQASFVPQKLYIATLLGRAGKTKVTCTPRQ